MRRPNLTSAKLGQSNTDFRILTDEQLDQHIAMLADKLDGKYGMLPTRTNWRSAVAHREARMGRTQGWMHCGVLLHTGDEVMAEVELDRQERVTYTGTVTSLTSRQLVVTGPSPYTGRECTTSLTRVVELVVL